MKELSSRQREVLAFVEKYLAEHGFPPSVSEIANNSGIAPATAAGHVGALRRKGLLDRTPQARSIVLTPGVAAASPVISIPIYSRIGSPDVSGDHAGVEGYCTLHRSGLGNLPQTRLFALRVGNEAMRGLGIFRNDIAVLRPPDPPPQVGDVVALVIGGEAVLRSFFPLADGRVELRPAHDGMSTIVLPHDALQLVGVLIAVQRFYLR